MRSTATLALVPVLCFCFCLGLSGAAAAADPAPFVHVVLFKFKKEAPPESVEQVVADFSRLPDRIPGFLLTFESAEALAAYSRHPAHEELVARGGPILDGLFVFDLPLDGEGAKAPPPPEPGRVHHLVFFRYKPGTTEEDRKRVEAEFAALERKVPGLLDYRSGRHTGEGTRNAVPGGGGPFTDGFLLTFIHQDARDDYLPHPDHRAFGKVLGPILDDVLVLDFTVRPSAGHLLVTGGLEPYQVVQQSGGKADLSFSGIAAGSGPIEARLLSGRRAVEGFDWRPVGRAERGGFRGVLEGVPAGGEYTVEVRRRDLLGNVAEVADVAHVLVGDLWVLAGQSNMEGVGDLADVETPDPRVHCFGMAHRWELAVEPLHTLFESRDPVHLGNRYQGLDEEGRRARREQDRKNRKKGAGLGLSFAKRLHEATGIPVGLIASAHGGTSMTQWDPALAEKGGESLYGSLLKQVRRAGGRPRGVLWYQGESDASPEAAPLYRERFKALAAAFRKDLGDPALPIFTVQIGRFVIGAPNAEAWSAVREAQRTLPAEIPGTSVATAVDLALDDLIHVGTQDLKRLGARLARLARREVFRETALQGGPALAGVSVEDEGRRVRVRFTGVNGRLLASGAAAGEVRGFSLRAGGRDLPLIYNAAIDPRSPDTVVLKLVARPPEDARLWYGWGYDPVCNLADAEDLAACAFGPLEMR